MDIPIEGLVILILSIGFMVGLGIWMAVKGRDLRWPDQAERFPIDHKTSGGWIRVHVLASRKFAPHIKEADRQACTLAVACTYEAWAEKFPDSAKKVYRDFEDIAVHLLTDYEYDQLDGKDQFLDNTNGTVGAVSRMLGSGIKRIIVRSKFVDQVQKHGGIVTHEAVHVANRAAGSGGNIWTDVRHETPGVFGANNEGSVEHLAREKFVAAHG